MMSTTISIKKIYKIISQIYIISSDLLNLNYNKNKFII